MILIDYFWSIRNNHNELIIYKGLSRQPNLQGVKYRFSPHTLTEPATKGLKAL